MLEATKFALGWAPVIGSCIDIYDGYNDGDYFTLLVGVGSLTLEVVTFGTAAAATKTAKAMNKIKKAQKILKKCKDPAKIAKWTKVIKQSRKTIKATQGLRKISKTAKTAKILKNSYDQNFRILNAARRSYNMKQDPIVPFRTFGQTV